MITPAQMRAHIEKLAAAGNIEIRIDPGLRQGPGQNSWDAHASSGKDLGGRPYINIPPIVDELSYVVALHELGHLYHHMDGTAPKNFHIALDAMFGNNDLQIAGEKQATEWAKEHALEWTPTMEKATQGALKSYERPSLRGY